MKKLILITLCLLTITTYAQNNKQNFNFENILSNHSSFLHTSTKFDESGFPNPMANWVPVGKPEFSARGVDYTSLAIAPNGTPYIAYSDDADYNKAAVMRFESGSWIPVGKPGFSADRAKYISLAIAPNNGIPYISYVHVGRGTEVVTVMKFESGSWVPVGKPGISARSVTDAKLAIAPNGTPYIGYTVYTGEANSGKASVIKFESGSWISVGKPGFSAGRAYGISLAIAPNGIPYIGYSVYTGEANDGKASVMKFESGSWIPVGKPGISDGRAGYISLAINKNSIPYISYGVYTGGANDGKASVMKFESGSWIPVGKPGISDGRAGYISLAIAPNGIPYIGYSDESNVSMATVMKFESGSWIPVGHPGFSAGKVEYTSLAIAPNGIPYIGYRDIGGERGWGATVMKFDGPPPPLSCHREMHGEWDGNMGKRVDMIILRKRINACPGCPPMDGMFRFFEGGNIIGDGIVINQCFRDSKGLINMTWTSWRNQLNMHAILINRNEILVKSFNGGDLNKLVRRQTDLKSK